MFQAPFRKGPDSLLLVACGGPGDKGELAN